MLPPESNEIEAIFEIPQDVGLEAQFELPDTAGISAVFELNSYITVEAAEEFLERYIYPLQEGLDDETERAMEAEGELSAEIEEIKQDIGDIEEIKEQAAEGHQAYETIQTYGDIVTHNADEFVTAVEGSPLIEVQKTDQTIHITSKTFVHEHNIAESVWEIEHDLNKHPSVDVVDSSGSVQIPNEIDYNSPNKLTVSFLAGFRGKAYLN